jgi:hypothetical protein
MKIRMAAAAMYLGVFTAAVTPAAAQQADAEWLAQCERDAQRASRSVACVVRPVTAALQGGALAVDAGANGGISAAGSGRGGVHASARIQAQAASRERAYELADAVRIVAAAGSIHADGLRTGADESWSVSYHVEVPHRADLQLTAVNGPISIREVTGRIRASTVNGPLSLVALDGDVVARTENGPLSIRLAGDRWSGAGLDAETRNGPVSLTVPDRYSAQLETGTRNGPFVTGIPVTVQGDLRRASHVNATLGSGGAPLRVVTSNGPVSIRRQ